MSTSKGSIWPVTLGGAGAAGLLAFLRRRRRALHNVAQEMHDTLLPAGVDEPIDAAEEPQGEGHAPGHRHLAPPPIEQPTESRRRRPFGPRYGDRSRQPRR